MKQLLLLIAAFFCFAFLIGASLSAGDEAPASNSCEHQAIHFLEWAYKNNYIKNSHGKWYMDECMAAGWPGDTSHTSKQLFQLFLKSKK